MNNISILKKNPNQGFTLIEVLVTLMISAIGLLGFIELQNRTQIANLEAGGRAFATLIASNMAEGIIANPHVGKDCSFPSTLKVGTDSGNQNYTCSANLAGQHSIREWHKNLVGVGEKLNTDTINVGGIRYGRGCINYTPPNPATGVLGKYTISVAWQGFEKTVAGGPAGSCGYGKYGDSGLHRLLSYEFYGPEVNVKSNTPDPPDDGFIPSSIGCPWTGEEGAGNNATRNHESFSGNKSCLLGDYVEEEHPHLHHMSGSRELWINGNITVKHCGGCFDDAAATIYYTGSNVGSCSYAGSWPSIVKAQKVSQAEFNVAADARR